jgi:L-Ala-D/L-Glu epimerase
VWRLLGLAPTSPATSYTIGIDSLPGTVDRTRRAEGYHVLKVKVGGPDDLARLEAVREHTSARIRIDGNEGWTLETARELMPRLRELDVEFVEQPFPVADVDGYRALRELPERIPVILDESVRDLGDVARAGAIADGINIKLAKSGGIREAVRMAHAARALGLGVMLGCMIESGLGIAAAAQVAPLCDHVDLDGNLLLAHDPWPGVEFRDGIQVPADEPGLGVREEVPDPR